MPPMAAFSAKALSAAGTEALAPAFMFDDEALGALRCGGAGANEEGETDADGKGRETIALLRHALLLKKWMQQVGNRCAPVTRSSFRWARARRRGRRRGESARKEIVLGLARQAIEPGDEIAAAAARPRRRAPALPWRTRRAASICGLILSTTGAAWSRTFFRFGDQISATLSAAADARFARAERVGRPPCCPGVVRDWSRAGRAASWRRALERDALGAVGQVERGVADRRHRRAPAEAPAPRAPARADDQAIRPISAAPAAAEISNALVGSSRA